MTRNQLLELFPLGNSFPIDGDTRRYDPVTAMAGSSILSAGTSIIGGLLGKSAAQKAAEAQQQAAAAAGAKVEGAVRDTNPQIIDNAANASDMALRAAGGVTDASKQANALLNPYATTGSTATGQLNNGLAAGGDFNKTPTMADIQIDPGFAFRLQQGELALGRSAAARGGAVSGAAMKDSTNYAQDAASQEYADAFGRYQTNTQNRFGNLMQASNAGQAAVNTQGGNTMDASKVGVQANEFAGGETYDAAKTTAAATVGGATQAADYLTQGANAKAAGIVGGANAFNAGITGAAGSVQNAAMLNALLQNPAAGTPTFNPATGGAVPPGYPMPPNPYTGAPIH